MYKIIEYFRLRKSDGTISDWKLQRRHLYEKEETFEKFWKFHTKRGWNDDSNWQFKCEAFKDNELIRSHIPTKE